VCPAGSQQKRVFHASLDESLFSCVLADFGRFWIGDYSRIGKATASGRIYPGFQVATKPPLIGYFPSRRNFYSKKIADNVSFRYFLPSTSSG
jgi:hypothetical protein